MGTGGLASNFPSVSIQSHVFTSYVLCMLPASKWLLDLVLNPEDGSYVFLRNVS
jgi:hypothetical protein